MSVHVHMLLNVPPKDAFSQMVVGCIKGKSAIHLARFWRAASKLRGAALLGASNFVSSVGRNEATVQCIFRTMCGGHAESEKGVRKQGRP
jgi:REP element-mobilizing transposase RayT